MWKDPTRSFRSLHIQAIDHGIRHQTRVMGDEAQYRVVDLEFNAGDFPLGGQVHILM